MIGRVIGSYEVQARIGAGGMGSVWRGLDGMLDRPVAIKALRADIASNPQAVERFRQEARILARFLHPHIATLYALLREGDDFFMVMEYVEGETFEELLDRRQSLAHAHAVPLVRQALDGIEQAHHHGVIHRDIKPANLILTPGGTVKVMDFGIARLRGTQRMTRTHFTIGTAAYMAPEQIRSRDLDARADVYALGVLLYELLTGRVPFQSNSSFEVMQAHLQTPPPPPSTVAPDLPDELEQIILRALEKKPDDRFPSAAALRDALDALDLPEPPFDLTGPTLAEAPVPEEPTSTEPTPNDPEATEAPAETRLTETPPSALDAATVVLPEEHAAPPPAPRTEAARTVLLSEVAPDAPTALASGAAAGRPAWRDRVQRHRRPMAGAVVFLVVLALGALVLSSRDDPPDAAEPSAERPVTLDTPPDAAGPPPLAQPDSADQTSPAADGSTPPADHPSPQDRPAEQETPASRPAPVAATGTVRVLVRPFGDVYVDGRRLAGGTNAPVTATLPTGTHRVRAVHPVLGALERRVTVSADRTHEVLIEFDATARSEAPVEITVLSDPVNAEILVDGTPTGRYTPATVRLAPGRYLLTLQRSGYDPATRRVTVAAARPDRVSFTLTPR